MPHSCAISLAVLALEVEHTHARFRGVQQRDAATRARHWLVSRLGCTVFHLHHVQRLHGIRGEGVTVADWHFSALPCLDSPVLPTRLAPLCSVLCARICSFRRRCGWLCGWGRRV